MRIPLNRDVNLGQLQDELTQALGRKLCFSSRLPGQLDNEGKELPGVIVLMDVDTAEPLPELSKADEKKVNDAIAAHVFVDPADVKGPAEELFEAIDSATSLDSLKVALKNFSGKKADEEKAGKPPKRQR